jgi:acetyl esterase/lipase
MRISYGEQPSQYGELHLPADGGRKPVVIVLHGGFWRQQYGLELGTPLARDLASHGVAAWNLEYRRLGGGGGYPETFQDVANGIDKLADLGVDQPIDLNRVVVLGHSAGGQLAVWAAARRRLPGDAPGALPTTSVRGAVSQAGVLDLAAAAAAGEGRGAVLDLVGGRQDRFAVTSPIDLVPLGVPVTCVHGRLDDLVPLAQSTRFERAARRNGDSVELISGAFGHFELIDPASKPWAQCREAALRMAYA